MEFGDTGELPARATEAPEPEQPAMSGGFELMEEAEPPAAEVAPVTEAPLDEEPSFTEEPLELGGAPDASEKAEIVTINADTEEPAIELSLDGIEEPPSSPEIVLDLDQPEDAAPC